MTVNLDRRFIGVIKIEKTMFDKLKEILMKEGWIEQDCGEIYFDGQYDTDFYSRDESEVIHLSHNTLPDENLINELKGEHEAVVTKECGKCGKLLYKGTESNARHLIIYCVDCPMDKELKS